MERRCVAEYALAVAIPVGFNYLTKGWKFLVCYFRKFAIERTVKWEKTESQTGDRSTAESARAWEADTTRETNEHSLASTGGSSQFEHQYYTVYSFQNSILTDQLTKHIPHRVI